MSDQYFKLFNPTDAQGTILKPQFGISITLSPKEESRPLPFTVLPEIQYYVDAYKWEVKNLDEQVTSQDSIDDNSSKLESSEVSNTNETKAPETNDSQIENVTASTETPTQDQVEDQTTSEVTDEVLTKKYTEDELNSLYKPDVVTIAEKRGLDVDGNKAELITRILEAQGA